MNDWLFFDVRIEADGCRFDVCWLFDPGDNIMLGDSVVDGIMSQETRGTTEGNRKDERGRAVLDKPLVSENWVLRDWFG